MTGIVNRTESCTGLTGGRVKMLLLRIYCFKFPTGNRSTWHQFLFRVTWTKYGDSPYGRVVTIGYHSDKQRSRKRLGRRLPSKASCSLMWPSSFGHSISMYTRPTDRVRHLNASVRSSGFHRCVCRSTLTPRLPFSLYQLNSASSSWWFSLSPWRRALNGDKWREHLGTYRYTRFDEDELNCDAVWLPRCLRRSVLCEFAAGNRFYHSSRLIGFDACWLTIQSGPVPQVGAALYRCRLRRRRGTCREVQMTTSVEGIAYQVMTVVLRWSQYPVTVSPVCKNYLQATLGGASVGSSIPIVMISS